MKPKPEDTICGHFMRRIHGATAKATDTKDQHAFCRPCLRLKGIILPKGYDDLGGLARCSACGVVSECRDPALMALYATRRIPPSVVFMAFPMLRAPLTGATTTMTAIESQIEATTGKNW